MTAHRTVATALLAVIITAGCAPQPQSAPEAATPPNVAPTRPTPPPASNQDPDAPADTSRPIFDGALRDAMHDYFEQLAAAGGGEFADPRIPERMFNLLIGELMNTTEVIDYYGSNKFAAGVELAAMGEDRAKWNRAGTRVLEILDAELAAWEQIEPAIDASLYGYLVMDEIALKVREYFEEDAAAYRDLVALTERDGPEALATPAAMRRIAAWLWASERSQKAGELVVLIAESGVPVDDELLDRINRAIPNLGMGIVRERPDRE
jgi:hypothetical protein